MDGGSIIWVYNQNKHWQDRIISLLEKRYPHFYQHQVCPTKALVEDLIYRIIMRRSIKNMSKTNPFPLFSNVEIETINRCNNNCSFCPINRNEDTRHFTLMSKDLFQSIIGQLRELQYSGSLCLFSNNEPLLDRRIIEFHEIARNALPQSHIYLYTNGTLLTIEKFQKLMKYLDNIIIDNYSDDLTLIKPVKEIYDFVRDDDNNNYQERLLIQFFRKSAIRSTRGGQAKNRDKVYQRRSLCVLPFSQLVVRPDGKISLCCQDALGKYTLGNLAEESLLDVWNGKAYWQIRNRSLHGSHEIDLCKFCDHFHYLDLPFVLKSWISKLSKLTSSKTT
jgi:radical SAM protein with 4Fe4S-binding SPASM domain